MLDDQSFIAVYDEYAQRIFKYCYFRVNSKEDAEDLASLVFTRVWDYISAGNKIDSIRAFLYQVAHNLIIDHYRKNKEAREVSLDNPDNPIDIPEESDFIQDVDQKGMVNDIRKKLHQLPDNYREAIILRYINDLSIKEVAQAMDITENNASVILHRAVEKLKSMV
ncbi:MAG: RNA polymerase sigma-70 factor, ECF subfamily [Parcubacteria group bacterium Licking1014_17]|nr:MAG: RNA polymerase sigma-70 factor, ECF subfamily [Parcubacteria group bacterium Licking1014_17]